MKTRGRDSPASTEVDDTGHEHMLLAWRPAGQTGPRSEIRPCAFVADPLSSWSESACRVTTEEGSGRLVRAEPLSISGAIGAASKLSEVTGVDLVGCIRAIRRHFWQAIRSPIRKRVSRYWRSDCTSSSAGATAFSQRLSRSTTGS